jgi:uncharacterized protein YoxC
MSILILVFTICLLSEFLVGLILGLYVFNPHVKEVIKKMSELGDALAGISTQLAKAKDEILAKIATLEGQIGTIPADAQANLDAVKAIAQALDDVVPDVPA